MGNEIMIGSMMITAIATVVIAWFAIANHRLSSKLILKDEEYRQQISDLYKAIVISNIMVAIEGAPKGTVGGTWD